MNIVTEELEVFTNRANKEFSFIRFIKPDKVLVWEEIKNKGVWGSMGTNVITCKTMDIRGIEPEQLKKIGIWDNLSNELRGEIENYTESQKDEIDSRMEKARGKRRNKYIGCPKELHCQNCGQMSVIPPSVTMKKVEKLGVFLKDYISGFTCKSCSPKARRGKKANPEYVGLPKTLKCACGREVVANYAQRKAKAEKENTTLEELVKNFVCQGCKRTIGRFKKQK